MKCFAAFSAVMTEAVDNLCRRPGFSETPNFNTASTAAPEFFTPGCRRPRPQMRWKHVDSGLEQFLSHAEAQLRAPLPALSGESALPRETSAI